MNMPNKIVWIDDNPDREVTAKELGAEFTNVKQIDISEVVKSLLNESSPRLVIIDHVLDKAAGPVHPVFKKGSTIAEAIKERWPHCPVVGVTAADNVEGIDVRTKGIYDALYRFTDFSKYVDRLEGIAQGFEAIKKSSKSTPNLIKLLNPPNGEMDRLYGALDSDLKNAQDASVASRMYRWVGFLFDRPGFLFDALWSATFLGLTETGFDVVRHIFEQAKYNGIFLRPDEPRWWSSQLAELLYSQFNTNAGELSWHVGRRLPGITDGHFSKCYFCKKDYPETVAFLDEASEQRNAMHLGCTLLHSRFKRELYFEDIRIMRGK